MNQLKTGAILNYVVIILNMLVGLLYTPYMLSKLGQSEYGLYSLAASVISYLTVLDLGMGNAIIRYTAKYRAEGKKTEQYEMFGMFLILYIIIGVITVIAGSFLYFNVNSIFGETMSPEEMEKAQTMIFFLVFNLAVTFPMSIFGSIITAYERFVFPRVINIIRTILNTVVMICLLGMGYKAVTMVIVQTTFNISTLVINYVYCKYELKIKIFFKRFEWKFLKEIAIYSFWIFLNVIMDRIYWNTGQFILGAVVSTASVAVFAVAINLEHMYMNLSTAVCSVFLPKVTGMVTKNENKKEISDLFIRLGRIQYVVISTILCCFIIFGYDFILLWAGEGYEDAYIITLLFFISLSIPLIQNLGITILQARNQMKFRSILYIIIAILSLVLQIILAKKFGGIGCAVAISGSLLIGQGLIMNIYYHKKQDLNIYAFWKEIFKMSIVPCTLCIIGYHVVKGITLSTWSSWGIAVIIFIAIYTPLFFYFSLNKDEQILLSSPLKKLLRKTNIIK